MAVTYDVSTHRRGPSADAPTIVYLCEQQTVWFVEEDTLFVASKSLFFESSALMNQRSLLPLTLLYPTSHQMSTDHFASKGTPLLGYVAEVILSGLCTFHRFKRSW